MVYYRISSHFPQLWHIWVAQRLPFSFLPFSYLSLQWVLSFLLTLRFNVEEGGCPRSGFWQMLPRWTVGHSSQSLWIAPCAKELAPRLTLSGLWTAIGGCSSQVHKSFPGTGCRLVEHFGDGAERRKGGQRSWEQIQVGFMLSLTFLKWHFLGLAFAVTKVNYL